MSLPLTSTYIHVVSRAFSVLMVAGPLFPSALDRGGDILSTNRGHYDLLNIFYLQPVSGGLVTFYADVEIIPAHDPLCEGAGSAGDVLARALHLQRDLLERGEGLAEDLYSHRRPYAGR